MKFCINCGTQLEDEQIFCNNCGVKQEDTVAVEQPVENIQSTEQQVEDVQPVDPFANQSQPVQPIQPVMNQEAPKQEKQKKQKAPKDPNKKSRKGLIIGLSVAGVVLVALIIAAVLSFPFKISVNSDKFTTKENVVNKTFEFSSNQIVKSVYYAVNPKNASDKKEYTKLKEFDGTMDVSVQIKDLKVAPGNGKIYFIIESIFSESEPICVNYKYTLGYYESLDEAEIKEVADGLYMVKNRVIVSVKDKVSEDNIKKLAEKYEAELVGMNYYTGEAQLKFDSDVYENLLDDLKEEDIVDDANFEYVFKNENDPVEGLNDGEAENNNVSYEQPVMPPETDSFETTEWVTETTVAEEDTTSEENTTSGEDVTTEEDTTPEEDTTTEEDTTSEEDTTTEEDTTSEEDTTTEEDTTPEEDTTTEENTTSKKETTTEAETEEDEIEDPYAGHTYSWNLEVINAPEVWKYTKDAVPVKVGVMDSFADYKHKDLQMTSDNMKIFGGQTVDEFYKFFKDIDEEGTWDNVFYSYLNHGTHVIGTIGAEINNDDDANGVSNNVDIYYANEWTYDYEGGRLYGYSSTYEFSYNLCSLVLSGTKVINYSVGACAGRTGYDINEYAVNYMDSTFKKLEDAGYDFVFVKAAGNDDMPADYDILVAYLKAGETSSKHTLVVGSIENTLVPSDGPDGQACYNFSWFSNYGELVDVAAPGSDIYSTYSFDKYGYMSGTSMATPHVTGVVALMYAANPDLTSEQVIEIVKNCASIYSVKYGYLCPVVDANLCVRKAIELKDSKDNDDIESNAPEGLGYVSGVVFDNTLETPASLCTLVFTSENDEVYYTTTNTRGEYEIAVNPGIYSLEVLSDEYVYTVVYGIEVLDGETIYNPIVNLLESSDENGIIEGSMINALNADKVSATLLEFRYGINNYDGPVVYRCMTDEEGNFKVELPAGNYTVEATTEGFESTYFVVNVIGGETLYNQNGTATPILDDGEIRIVLTWGERPMDLDSHLYGPLENEYRYHIYYNEKGEYRDGEYVARLDVDDTTSYGPETTSVYIPNPGKYTFTVYDYSNRSSISSMELANSSATVMFYAGDGSRALTFNVPNREGNYWKVFSFEITEDGRVKNFRVDNEMGYTSSTGYQVFDID